MKNREAPEISVSITKEELGNLPIERYDGKIVIVSSEKSAEKAINDLRNSGIVGFDTETRPAFKKGQINNVALVQLSNNERCYLFRLSKMGFPIILKDFLEDNEVLKIGLSVKDDFLNLSRYEKIEPRGFIDLQQYVKDFKIKDNSLSKIYGIIFGKRISKGQQLSNWEASTLSVGQKNYAALDAKACLQIYHHLKDGLFSPIDSGYCHYEEKDKEI